MTTQQLPSEHVKFLSEANHAAMKAKARLQIEAQTRCVASLSAEIADRLDSVMSKIYQVRTDVRKVEDGDTSGSPRTYPVGAFGSSAEDLDGLLAALHKEVEHLHGLRRAEEETEALTDQFDGRVESLLSAVPEPDSEPVPTGGQYL